MPTPFSHIVLAERILKDGRLPSRPKQRLSNARPAFLLGNTAPDFGSLVGRDRHETHFFQVPIARRQPAHLRLLEQYPELADPDQLQDDQAAFIAGYLAHLWLDQAWILKIFQPVFGFGGQTGTFQDRLIEHNLLRAYIDQEDRQQLPEGLGKTLSQAEPASWLPFASDNNLRRWRDHLASQLQPQGHVHTIEVFADRLNMPAKDFAQRLESEAVMQETLSRLPEDNLKSFFAVALDHAIELVSYYFEGRPGQAPRSSQPVQQITIPGYGETAP